MAVPVRPTRPIWSPAETVSPGATVYSCKWAYFVVMLPCWSRTQFPSSAEYPTATTAPSAAASTGVPPAWGRSMPPCSFRSPVMGWTRPGNKLDSSTVSPVSTGQERTSGVFSGRDTSVRSARGFSAAGPV